MTASDDPVDARLIQRISGEFREMPGLALTLPQARRLWGCDSDTCSRVIEALVAEGILRWSRERLLIRA
jgi:hypothetical protein